MADFPVYKCIIDPDVESNLQVEFIALVDKPAIEKNFVAFNASKFKYNVDNKKRIISGPAMIADMLIYRNMEPLGEFYTVFDKETISSIVQKFFKKGFVHNFNLMHDSEQTKNDITIFESFLIDRERGVMPPTGYEDVADGSWFISAKVEDDDSWKKVEDGTFKGFSVEGIFQQIPVKVQKFNAESILKTLSQLLEKWDGN